jgi:hypothetical protein
MHRLLWYLLLCTAVHANAVAAGEAPSDQQKERPAAYYEQYSIRNGSKLLSAPAEDSGTIRVLDPNESVTAFRGRSAVRTARYVEIETGDGEVGWIRTSDIESLICHRR